MLNIENDLWDRGEVRFLREVEQEENKSEEQLAI